MVTLPQLLVVSAIFLVIPAAILLGRLTRNGPIIVSSAAAVIVSAIYWIWLGGPALNGGTAELDSRLPVTLLFYGGPVLLVAASSLAINAAALSKQSGWVLLLILGGYISFAAMLIALFDPAFCLAVEPGYFTFGPLCPGGRPVAQLAFAAGHLLGPTLILVYGVLAPSGQRRHRSTVGIPLRALPSETNEDTEPDMNRGRR